MEEEFLMTTASSLEGYVIVKQCGVVFGETIFKNSALDSLGASINNLVDSLRFKATEMTGQMSLVETARDYAYNKMIKEAKRRGANAIIAIDSDNTIGNNAIMYISLYGTAVKVMSIEEKELYDQQEKERKIKAKEEEERKAAAKLAFQEQMSEQIASGEKIEELFMQQIEDEVSMESILEKWEEMSMSKLYPEVDKYIKEQVKKEKNYGNHLIENKKATIRKMLLDAL